MSFPDPYIIMRFYPHRGSCVDCGEYHYRRSGGEVIHPDECVNKDRYDHKLDTWIYQRPPLRRENPENF